MSYHRSLGSIPGPSPGLPPMTSTQLFAESVDPYSWRNFPPGSIYAPYGWGPGFNIGMPFNYTHHIGYERVPVRRPRGGLFDRLSGGLSGILAVL